MKVIGLMRAGCRCRKCARHFSRSQNRDRAEATGGVRREKLPDLVCIDAGDGRVWTAFGTGWKL